MALTLDGMAQVTQRLQRLVAAPLPAAGEALYAEGNGIMGQSVQLVPVDRRSHLAWPAPWWNRQYPFNRPASTITLSNGTLSDRNKLAPLRNTMRFSVVGQKHVVASITGLNLACFPRTVFRAIRTIIVFTPDSMLRSWAWPHIVQEGEKRPLPLRANGNASSSISRVICAGRTQTALFHSCPGPIFRGVVALWCATVLRISSACGIA